MPSQAIGYLLKRYPRLSETFILNEIRALERLGTRLHVFSLMQPEEAPAHPALAEVRAPVTYFPAAWWARAAAIVKAHAVLAVSAPRRYLRALGLALWWSVRFASPFGVWKQFLRSAYVAQACRRQGIRHLHAHFANAPALVGQFASLLGAMPFSFSTHAKDLYLTPRAAMRSRVRSAVFVLTCTQYNVDYLRSFLPAEEREKIHLVYHGIDLAAFAKIAGETPADEAALKDVRMPLVLSVGRLVPKKGMADLIAACALLRDRGLHFRCVIVGEGPLRGELEKEIRARGLDHMITLPGAMAHDRLLSVYGQADLFALAPRVTANGDRDGIPNVLVEAMAAGVPVVTTAVSGIPELIEDGKSGLLVAAENSVALADAMERLLRDPATARRLAAAARGTVETHFECWETAKAVCALMTGEGPALMQLGADARGGL